MHLWRSGSILFESDAAFSRKKALSFMELFEWSSMGKNIAQSSSAQQPHKRPLAEVNIILYTVLVLYILMSAFPPNLMI